jgi:hypothetical protein
MQFPLTRPDQSALWLGTGKSFPVLIAQISPAVHQASCSMGDDSSFPDTDQATAQTKWPLAAST